MSALYYLLKPVVTVAVHIFYKKIEVVNRERLNEPGPTLIVSNHNNAFLDAVVVEMFAKPQYYSLARGDVFKNPVIHSLLKALRIIPIYRKDEGPGMFEKNEATFETCIGLLEQQQHIIMYPEGDCVTEKRLRKLKKGAARIALRAEAENDFKLNVRIIPVGLNYSAARKFRSNLFIKVGKAITLSEYRQQYKQDSIKAINALTQHIENEMRSLVVDIHQHSNDRLYEDVLAFYKPQLMQTLELNPKSLKDDDDANGHIASAINHFHNSDHDSLKSFKHQLRNYHEVLDKLQIPQRLFTQQNATKLSYSSAAKDFFLLGLGLPLHIIGLAFNYLPYRLAYSTTDKKVKQAHFHASVNFVIGMFGWIGYYLFQLLILSMFFKNVWVTIIFALLIPLTGWYSLHFYSFIRHVTARWNMFSLLQNNEDVAAKLFLHRQELLAVLEKARSVYCKSTS